MYVGMFVQDVDFADLYNLNNTKAKELKVENVARILLNDSSKSLIE